MWRNSLRHLPLPKGPWAPGCIDWISGYGENSTLVRLYYPTAFHNKENDPTKWFQWCPHPKYIDSFAKIISLWGNVLRSVIWLYGGEPLVPCMWQVPPLKQKMPVVVFSHGFGATRFLSSNIATELASFGFLVASIEHKDSSAAATYYYESEGSQKENSPSWIEHIKMTFGPDHYRIRNSQIHVRLTEVIQLLDLLGDLNEGRAENILNCDIDIRMFKDALDMTKISMMGHSFGGATTLLTMANDPRIKCGVILDGWMYPIKDEALDIKGPLLFINSQTFHIESNIQALEKLVNRQPDERDIITIKHTTHESQTDTPHIMGYWMNWFMYKLPPETAANINNYLLLNFIKKHIGLPKDEHEEGRRLYLEMHSDNFVNGTIDYYKKETANSSKL